MVSPEILYEDKDLMVVDKPAGMVVNRSETSGSETVQDWVEKQNWWGDENEEVFVARSGIAHRLDKETSGCLIIAKNTKVLTDLMKQFKEREIEKEYLAITHGRLEPKEGTIRLPIGRDRYERKKRKVVPEGKGAETTWEVEKYLGQYTVVRLRPKTGRTHQIRVHLAHLGCPIVGDSLYLNKKQIRMDREKLKRHLLHAAKIAFRHPVDKRRILVSTKEPKFVKLVE